MTSQIYLGKLHLETSVMSLVDYTVKGIEQQSNQEIWFSDKVTSKAVPGTAAARAEKFGAGGGGAMNWMRLAAKIKVRMASSNRTQLLTTMARQLALEEARADQVRAELDLMRLRTLNSLDPNLSGSSMLPPGRKSGVGNLDIDFSQPLIPIESVPSTSYSNEPPARERSTSSRPTLSHGRASQPALKAGTGTQATGAIAAARRGDRKEKEKDKEKEVQSKLGPRTISFAHAAPRKTSPMAGTTFRGSGGVGAGALSTEPSHASAASYAASGREGDRPQPSASPSPRRRSRAAAAQKPSPLGSALDAKGAAAEPPLAGVALTSMDETERTERASSVYDDRGSEYSDATRGSRSARGDDDYDDALARPVFTTAANFDKLDDLLLHRSDEQEIRMTALRRRTNEASREVESFFKGKVKQGRRGSIMGPGSSIDGDGTPRLSLAPDLSLPDMFGNQLNLSVSTQGGGPLSEAGSGAGRGRPQLGRAGSRIYASSQLQGSVADSESNW